MKIQRHAVILRVVRDRRIESQDELREALAAEGVVVTQATLSRDIRELGLAKLADPQGGAYYAHPHRAAVRPDLAQVLPTLLVSVDGVGPAARTQDGERVGRSDHGGAGSGRVGGDHRDDRRRRHGPGDHAQPANPGSDREPYQGAGEEVGGHITIRAQDSCIHRSIAAETTACAAWR